MLCDRMSGCKLFDILKEIFEKVHFDNNKSFKNYPACKEWGVNSYLLYWIAVPEFFLESAVDNKKHEKLPSMQIYNP